MRIDEIEAGQKRGIDSIDSPHDEIARFVQLVQTECSDAWNAYDTHSMFLYRGIQSMKDSEMVMFHGKTRNNRRPAATKNAISEAIDGNLIAMGFTAIRSNSIFCSSHITDAASYGKAYIIFPKNGFQFTWSPKVADLFIELASSDVNYTAKMIRDMTAEEFQDAFGYTNVGFGEALESYNEIMISGEYYACEIEEEEEIAKYMP